MSQSTISSSPNAAVAASGTPVGMLWTGRVISGVVSAALIFSGVIKFTNSPDLVEGLGHLGWPVRFAPALGVTELTCVVLYLIPQTSALGAILLTGYMGGAIATHARIEDGFIPHIIIGVLVWLGLFLRDARLRALIPIRRGR